MSQRHRRPYNDVLEMVDQRGDGDATSTEVGSVHHHTNGPTGVGYRAELQVADVSPVLIDARQASVRHEKWLCLIVYLDRIEKPRAADVGKIDADPKLVQTLDVRLAKIGQACASPPSGRTRGT